MLCRARPAVRPVLGLLAGAILAFSLPATAATLTAADLQPLVEMMKAPRPMTGDARKKEIKQLAKQMPKLAGMKKANGVYRLAYLYWAKAQTMAEPLPDAKSSKRGQYLSQAAANWTYVAKNYRGHPKRDRAILSAQVAHLQAGKTANVRYQCERLLETYPDSERRAGAQYVIGLLYELEGKTAEAATSFAEAKTHADTLGQSGIAAAANAAAARLGEKGSQP